MMKKISRLAALFAATAFLLAAFPACDNDDGDDDPKATLAGEAVELEIDVEKAVAATITVENDTFSANAKKIPSGEAIPTEYFELKAGEKVTVSPATLVAWTSYTVAKISFTVTATEGAAAGTISAEIKKGTLTSDTALTAKGIAYTVKGASGSGDGEGGGSGEGDKTETGTPATAKTYSFTGGENGIVAADISDWDLSAKDVINAPIAKELTTKVLANGASLSWKGSKVATLRFRATHEKNEGTISDLAPTITALNYNGGANSDISNGIAIDSLDRYISIPVDGAGTVSAEVTFKGAKDTDNPTGGPFQVAFVDADGKVLGTVVPDELTASSTKTVSGTVTAAGTAYLAFSRNGAKKSDGNGTGGIDVSTITVAPAAN